MLLFMGPAPSPPSSQLRRTLQHHRMNRRATAEPQLIKLYKQIN